MRKLSGTVVCNGTGKPFESNTKAIVQVVDISFACGPSISLGKTELKNLTKFPLSFTVEYNDQPNEKINLVEVAVQVRIETGERLDYINDTRFSILKGHLGFLDSIEMFVVPVE